MYCGAVANPEGFLPFAGKSGVGIWARSELKPGSIGLAVVAPRFLGRSSPFRHDPMKVLDAVVHLLKHAAKCLEFPRRIGGKAPREALARERGHFAGKVGKSRFHGIKRRRALISLQGRPTRPEVIGIGRTDARNRRCEARRA